MIFARFYIPFFTIFFVMLLLSVAVQAIRNLKKMILY